MRIKRIQIDNSIEELIATGMVISTDFLKRTYLATIPDYFKVSSIKIIVQWCRKFFEENNKAPGEDILEVFRINERDLSEDDSIVVQKHLEKILDLYDEKTFNVKYIIDKGLPYLESNALEKLAEEILILLKRGEVHQAKILKETGFKEVFQQMSQVMDIFDKSELDDVFGEKQEALFRMGGELGNYLHPLKRGKLYALLGPPKRGKSYWLIEWAFQAFHSGLKVMFFSLEMSSEEVKQRFIERILGKQVPESYEWLKKKAETYMIPVFDCLHNQTGKCSRKECASPKTIVIENEEILPYENNPKHKPCRACDNWEPTTWMVPIKRKYATRKEAEKALNSLERDVKGGSLKMKTFPIRTASVKEMENFLDEIEILEGWIPDVVVIDYAGIIKENFKISSEKRHRVGAIWEDLSQIAKKRNVQVVTAGQGNREAARKDKLDSVDISEDWSIIMTIDVLIALNQGGQMSKDKEKKDAYWNRMYIEILEHRFKEVQVGKECLVLYQRKIGQQVLDSKII